MTKSYHTLFYLGLPSSLTELSHLVSSRTPSVAALAVSTTWLSLLHLQIPLQWTRIRPSCFKPRSITATAVGRCGSRLPCSLRLAGHHCVSKGSQHKAYQHSPRCHPRSLGSGTGSARWFWHYSSGVVGVKMLARAVGSSVGLAESGYRICFQDLSLVTCVSWLVTGGSICWDTDL